MVKNIPCCLWSNLCIPKLVHLGQASLLARILSSKASQLTTKNYHPGRTLIFRINSRYVLFENYTATHFDLPISQLHVPLTVIKENFTAKDFSIIHEQFAESQNGLTDLHSLLSVISLTAVDRDEVKNAINMMISTEDESANMSEVATDLQTFSFERNHFCWL